MPDPVFSSPPSPENPAGTPSSFKPNIYPIMYWALAFGVIAGTVLFLVYLLSSFLTLLWFPVFLAGVIWGGYRNYKIQKQTWSAAASNTPSTGSPWEEFKQAGSDILEAARDLMSQEAPPQSEEALPPVSDASPDEAQVDTDENPPLAPPTYPGQNP